MVLSEDPLITQSVTIKASNGWKLPNGDSGKSMRQYVCVANSNMSPPVFIRVVFQPILLVIGIIISCGLVFKTTGLDPKSVSLPALVLVVCAIVLCTSRYWTMAVLLVLSVFMAMGAAHKTDSYFTLLSMLFQFLVLAFVCGLYFEDATGSNIMGMPLANSGTSAWSALSQCRTYFSFFAADDTTLNWKQAAQGMTSVGFCSKGWVAFTLLMGTISTLCQVLMLVGTGLLYVDGQGPKMGA